jgi:predicted nucleic acid-binding protein
MVLIDTSIWVDYLRGTAHPLVVKTVGGLLDDHEVAITPVIRLELLRGASLQETEELQGTLGGLHELPFERWHWPQADRLVVELRAKGLTPSIADLLIVTSALDYRVPLYHQDRVFDAIARSTRLALYQ